MRSDLQLKKLALRFAATAGLVVALGLQTPTVLAHSKGPKVTPTDGSQLAQAPKEISFSFARPVRLTAVDVFDAQDSEIELPGKRSIEAARTRSIELPPLADGVYRVEWRALSADGHPVSGEFSFSVGVSE